MKLQPYPEYKDSGVPWLGEIPAHWDCLPNRALFYETKDQQHIDEPLLSVTIKRGIIRQSQLLANSSKKDSSNSDKAKYKLVCPNDIAYNKMRAWQGAIGVSKFRGIVSPAYVVVRLRRNDNPDYFHYLLRTPSFAKEAERRSYGIASDMWSLRPEHFKLINSCIPGPAEQNQIARFLEWKTTQINQFIRNKRQLVELLREQKQNVINQAVTTGLDPSIKLKPSGVEWIGDIPEHWNIHRFKFLCRNLNEQSSTKEPDEIYVALENVKGWTGLISQPEDEIDFDSQVKRFRPNDVLFGKLRPYLAKVARPQLEGVCVSEFLVLRATGNVSPAFLEHKLRSKGIIDLINSSTFGAKMPRADWTFIGNIKFPYPPVKEQQQIVEYINKKCAEIDQAITRAEREIELIQEYRTRLISDVVTGQVDVRGIDVPEVTEDDLLPLDENASETGSMADERMEDEV